MPDLPGYRPMDIDDPQKPEFASWRSFHSFANRVQQKRRYVWDRELKAFLDTVLATLRERDVNFPRGTILFRAQLGVDYDPVTDEDGKEIGEEPHGFGAARMKPSSNRAREGRINPAGIPVLYLASSEL